MRKTALSLLTATSLVLFGATVPAQATAACVSGTDYTSTTSGSNTILKFKVSTCEWTVPLGVTSFEFLAAGGGGGGGGGLNTASGRAGGGGGGGGEVINPAAVSVTPASVVLVTVGAGGTRGQGQLGDGSVSAANGSNGGNSSLLIGATEYLAHGGGGGQAADWDSGLAGHGGTSGSGKAYSEGSGTQGGQGGSSSSDSTASTTTQRRAQNVGTSNSITGSAVVYGSGAGGSGPDNWGWGFSDSGGTDWPSNSAGSGGQGGRGSWQSAGFSYGYSGADGQAGQVVIKYLTPATITSDTPVLGQGETATVSVANTFDYQMIAWFVDENAADTAVLNTTWVAQSSYPFAWSTFASMSGIDNCLPHTLKVRLYGETYGAHFGGSDPVYVPSTSTPAGGNLLYGTNTPAVTIAAEVTVNLAAATTGCTHTASTAVNNSSMGSATSTDANEDGTWDLVATPAMGYHFTGWSCTNEQSPVSTTLASTTITPDEDTTCTATFAVNPITVAAYVYELTGGTATASDANSDGVWNIVATAAAGYHFDHWSCIANQTPASTTAATTTVTPTASTTCVAYFAVGAAPTSTPTPTPSRTAKPNTPSGNNVVLTPGKDKLNVKVTYPGAIGTAPTRYEVTIAPGTQTCQINSVNGNCDLTGLVEGVTYTVSVFAINSFGTSLAYTYKITFGKFSTGLKVLKAKKLLTNFLGDSPVLTVKIKASVKSFLKSHPTLKSFICTGYTAGKVVLKTDLALAKARAKNVCNYIRSLRPGAIIRIVGKTPGTTDLAGVYRKVFVAAYSPKP